MKQQTLARAKRKPRTKLTKPTPKYAPIKSAVLDKKNKTRDNEGEIKRTLYPVREPLPERLKSGQWMMSKTGWLCQIVVTSQTNEYDERLYRFKFPPQQYIDNTSGRTWIYSTSIVGNGLYSRDQMEEWGMWLLTWPYGNEADVQPPTETMKDKLVHKLQHTRKRGLK